MQIVEESITQPSTSSIPTNSSNTLLISNKQLRELIQNKLDGTREKFEPFANIPEKIEGFLPVEKAEVINDMYNSSSQTNYVSKQKFEMNDGLDYEAVMKLTEKPAMGKFEELSSQNPDFASNIFSELMDTCALIEADLDNNLMNTSERMEYTIDESGILSRKNLTTIGRLDSDKYPNKLESREVQPPKITRKKTKKVDDCSVLTVSVNSASNYELKKVILTTERPFYCDICGLTFKRKDHVRSHKKWVHLGVRKNDFKCEKCGKMLKSNDGLEQHMRRHLNLKPFQCKECSMAFFSRRCLLKHSKIHYNTPSPVTDGVYQCTQCSNKYKTEKDLQIHHNWHQLPLVCDICFERFEFMKQLLCHKRVHTTYHPYKCNICSESFRQNRSLQAHTLKCLVKFSPREKKLKSKQENSLSSYCEICDKMFSSLSAFHEHYSIHSKKAFMCRLCEVDFTKEEAYLNHMACHEITTLCDDSEAVHINIISDLSS